MSRPIMRKHGQVKGNTRSALFMDNRIEHEEMGVGLAMQSDNPQEWKCPLVIKL
jgi:hypothetical protein